MSGRVLSSKLRMASYYSSSSGVSTGIQLLSAVVFWLLLQSRVDAQNRRDEVRTLLSFKAENMNFPAAGNRLTWRETDENPCAWVGVVCTANSTVLELDLSGWGWYVENFTLGELSSLRDLRILDLSSNYLIGPAAEGIGNLTGLTLLNLSSSWLDTFPDLGNLTELTLLDLSLNDMSGEIPGGISACRNLRSLSLQYNRLDGGISTLRTLVKLQILLLAHNDFSGPFPQELGGLTSLATIDLSDNSFDGPIPSLPDLSKLAFLTLDNNNFADFETDWFLGANSTLRQVSVSFNLLAGTIPSSLTKLPELAELNMSGNRLSGIIPFGFSHLLNNGYSSLDLCQNQLTGSIPDDVLHLQQSGDNCAVVNLSRNFLTGSIPKRVGRLCFVVADFSHNNLSGLPWSVQDRPGCSIQELWLQNNQLSGDIIDMMLHSQFMYAAEEIHLQNNLFTGDLSRVVNMRKLVRSKLIDLSNNDLRWRTSEAIPDPIQAVLRKLSSISPNLREFRVGGNNFLGTPLPQTCFVNDSVSLHGYQVLDLSNCQLNGEILGAAFTSSCLPGLEFLNLSSNHITGRVPESIVTIPHLTALDVSNNRLSGSLPTLPFNSTLINRRFYGGNDALCGYPLELCPVTQSGPQWWWLLLSIGGSLTIALISCSAATWRWRMYRRKHQQDADLIKALLERDSATLMPLRELRKATHNFAHSAQIGQGGFGTVYLGKLNDGTLVAIKRSKREGSEKDKEQFLNEVRILSQVTHRNLVKLMGCCMEKKTAVLVFEFVSNGTLQEHLQGKIGAVRLTWKERLNIAVQTADALNYLHSAAIFPIFHRDVKSANILLNDDLSAKVADFGISRLAPLQATHVSTAAVQGTMGYIDPEYYTSCQLTDRSDVYSFGVVLLELISAKPALDFRRVGDETSLVNFASPYIERGDLEGLLDPALTETYTDLAGHGRESILNLGKLAMTCVAMRSKARPSMNEVLKELQSLSFEFNDGSTKSDSVKEDDDEDARPDHTILLSESFCSDSSSFTIDGDAISIQLSQFSRAASFNTSRVNYRDEELMECNRPRAGQSEGDFIQINSGLTVVS